VPANPSPTPSSTTIEASDTASTSTLPIWIIAAALVAAGACGLLVTWRLRRRPSGTEG
jgi:hypothetical protein